MNQAVEQPTLHPFCLPEQVINSLQFIYQNSREYQQPTTIETIETSETIEHHENQRTKDILSNFTCTVCNTNFESHGLQREHFRSDWHRFNLKLTTTTSSTSHKPIDHARFTNMLEDYQDSLSGSDSSSSESDSSDSESNQSEHHKLNGSKSSNNFKQSRSIGLQDRFQQMLSVSSSTRPSLDSSDPIRLPSTTTSPLVWFTLSTNPSSQEEPAVFPEEEQIVQLGFYRTIFPKTFPQDRSLSQDQEQLGPIYRIELAALQRPFLPTDFSPPSPSTSNFISSETSALSTWTLIMIGGGHFAAMVVSSVPKLRHIGKNKAPEIEPVILHHKTFHRYTTRRKQGGGQASHDAGGKGAAKSAGASLRRYNEQALFQDIHALLKAWEEPISHSDLIFIRSSKSNLKTLFKNKDEPGGYKLTRGDPRVRSLPFVTKRPTFNELKRCFNELTRVKIFKTTRGEMILKEKTMRETFEREQARRDLQAAKIVELEARQRAEEERKRSERMMQKREKTAEEKEQELEDSRWERAMDMVKKGKLEALQEFVEKHSQTEWFGRLPDPVVERTELSGGFVSLLQLASMADQTTLVEWMLEKTVSDPTMVALARTGASKAHLAPYELAPSRLTRNVFRRAMAKNPTQWDWVSKAKVPSALTEELESNQNNKNKEWNKKLKEKLKERDRLRAENEKLLQAQKPQKQEEPTTKNVKVLSSTTNRLDGGSVARKTNVLSSASLAGLSDEQRLRLERERRARAAEARLK